MMEASISSPKAPAHNTAPPSIVRIYFRDGETYRLFLTDDERYLVDTPAKDILAFSGSPHGGGVVTLNPNGPWALSAPRIRN